MWEVISQEQNPVTDWDGMIWLPSHHFTEPTAGICTGLGCLGCRDPHESLGQRLKPDGLLRLPSLASYLLL